VGAVTVVATTSLPPDRAFAAVTDWPAHGRHVPLTTVRVVHDAGGVGTRFTATTALGSVGFDDPMEVTRWEPPADGGSGRATVVKRGVLRGGAEVEVHPDGAGSRVVWTETIEVGPQRLAPVVGAVGALPSRVVFGRVVRRLLADAERSRG
jgi:carbon monoxide dehydrogenase subunit G